MLPATYCLPEGVHMLQTAALHVNHLSVFPPAEELQGRLNPYCDGHPSQKKQLQPKPKLLGTEMV